jgi:hypothetical protein
VVSLAVVGVSVLVLFGGGAGDVYAYLRRQFKVHERVALLEHENLMLRESAARDAQLAEDLRAQVGWRRCLLCVVLCV